MADRNSCRLMRTLWAAALLAALAAPALAQETELTTPAAGPPGADAEKAAAPPPAGPSRPALDPVAARVRYLHDRLRITPAQEPLWRSVAQAMQENAKAAAPLIRERLQSSEAGDAVSVLGSYEKLGEAQLVGLKKFIAAFDALYPSLSVEQKKIADSLFRLGPLGMIGGIPQLAEELIAPPAPAPAHDYVYYPPYTPPFAYPGYPYYPTYSYVPNPGPWVWSSGWWLWGPGWYGGPHVFRGVRGFHHPGGIGHHR